jgi:glutathione synthase/RimK-type ligase-like ATP-grasp enzyme
MKDTIVLLTYEKDATSHEIFKQVRERGIQVMMLDTGDFPTRAQMNAWSTSGGEWHGDIRTANGTIQLEHIRSILYRRPTHYRADPALPAQVQQWAENESNKGFGGILRNLDCFWVSEPEAIRAASFKPRQISLAHRLGMETPRTLITNDPDSVKDFSNACGGQIICKSLHGGNIGVTKDEWDTIYTSVVTPEDLEHVEQVRYQAHQFQELIEKAYEVRVTIVGNQAFAARIDAPESNIDFRSDYGHLHYAPYQLPIALEQACLKMVKAFGLRYGALDILRDKSGAYFFLEINPAGQYQWIEFYTSLPITAALVYLLIEGKDAHSS